MSSIISENIDINLYNEKVIFGEWYNIKYRFHILRNNNFKKNKNLISASLFKLPYVDEVYASQKNISLEELRREHQSKSNGYITGLNNIILKTNDINIRIYCDNTSVSIVEKYLNNKNVEIVYFYFEQFYNFESDCHYGFFGTLMRYIPLFNFDEFDNKWDNVIVIDLENNFYNVRKLINNFLKKSVTNLIFWSRPCYYLSSRVYAMEHDFKKFSIISSFLMQKKQQDKKIFQSFLLNLLIGDDVYDRTLRKYLNIDFSIRYFGGRLEYGVDEYFINYYFFNECYIKKNLPFNIIFSRDVAGGILEWIKNIRFSLPKKTIKNPDITKKFLEIIIEIFFPKNMILPEDNIDNQIYWTAEKYYLLNLQYLQRKIDQTDEINKLYNKILEKEFNELDLYDDYIFGLGLNVLLSNNFYTNFLIRPNEKYPLIKQDVEWNVQKV